MRIGVMGPEESRLYLSFDFKSSRVCLGFRCWSELVKEPRVRRNGHRGISIDCNLLTMAKQIIHTRGQCFFLRYENIFRLRK